MDGRKSFAKECNKAELDMYKIKGSCQSSRDYFVADFVFMKFFCDARLIKGSLSCHDTDLNLIIEI